MDRVCRAGLVAVAVACTPGIVSPVVAGAPSGPGGYASHSPMRPLPAATDRPLPRGPTYFIDARRGDDAAAGTEAAPWRTIGRGVKGRKPGDTLVLRAGTYYECVHWTVSGEKDAPITLRAYPGELAILDGGFREFYEQPETAWEPFPDGAAGEYRSTRSYPVLAQKGRPRRDVYVTGNFGDSMVPLHGYHNLVDLRTDNPYWTLDDRFTEAKGFSCGPGVWLDTSDFLRDIIGEAVGTFRVHIRLAHTHWPGLGPDNYRGETDPRKLRLVIGGPGPVLEIEGARHLRFQDLVLRGTRAATLRIASSEEIELDGLTVYSGASALETRSSARLRVTHTAFRGLSAPWSFRASQKYRGIDAFLFETEDAEPLNRDFEFAYCEFTDHHDCMLIHGVHTMKLHHSLIDNFNDDGIDFGPKKKDGQVQIYQNILSRCLQVFTLHGGREPGPFIEHEPDSGVSICRNVLDLRAPVYAYPPRGPEDSQKIATHGRSCIDHGSPIWPVYRIYHNTVVCLDPPFKNQYGDGQAVAMRGTQRWILNNVFVTLRGLPGMSFTASGEEELEADYNLHWGVREGPGYHGDFLAVGRAPAPRQPNWFEISKKRYPPGWTAHDRFADPKLARLSPDPNEPADVRPRSGSPVVDSGGKIPPEWPDPVRGMDSGAPDLGAVPSGCEPWRVGVRGRLGIAEIGGRRYR